MATAFSGSYPLESRAGEIERLRVQSDAWAPDTEAMLERIGVGDGWSCLDIGCGPGGITGLLSKRVGQRGRVVGLDMNSGFLDHARGLASSNTEFVLGDAFKTNLPAGSFDLVHSRFVASTSGTPERLLTEAIRLAKPGGTIALQEPDASSLSCYPLHPAFDKLKAAWLGAYQGVGADVLLARRLYSVMVQTGLHDVQLRTCILGVRPVDPMIDILPSSVESLRGTVFKLGLIKEAEFAEVLADCRKHLQTVGTGGTTYMVAQVWGRKGG